jgi:2-polyprenyl-6-methoxyphenol hydroxylase-like FAD-dependent oxidoreductase
MSGGADTYPNFIRANRLKLREWLCIGIDVQWNKNFAKCERNEDGTVTAFFTDGSTETGDILVGADGASSHVRNNIYKSNPPKFSLTPIGTLGGELSLSPEDYLHQCSLAQSFYIVHGPTFRFFVGLSSYTPTQSKHYWFLAWEDEKAVEPDFWLLTAKPEEILAYARNATSIFEPKFRRILELQEPEGMMHPFLLKEVIPTPLPEGDPWTILGDAAHAMTPFQAQGANHAMQDALELCDKIVEVVSNGSNNYAEALRKYEEAMIPRATQAVQGSRNAWQAAHTLDESWRK